MTETLTRPGPLVERVAFRLKSGTRCTLSVHSTHRKGGRRLIVRDDGEKVLADTDDQFDMANASNRLDELLADIDP